MSRVPTLSELDELGTDAGKLLDATREEIARAIPMAASPVDRRGLVDELKRVDKLFDAYFGAGDAA